MAPNKFEKHIKKELQEREIVPSANAWERVSEKLEAPNQNKKKGYFWYGIAAGFIGILMVSILYFSSEKPINNIDNQTVDTNDKPIEAIVNNEKEVATGIEEAVTETEQVTRLSVDDVVPIVQNPAPKVKNGIATVQQNQTLVTTEIEKQVISGDSNEQIINSKLIEIVAKVDSLEQNNMTITDAEVNDLLRNAQEELLRNKLFSQNGSVDAMALLNDVEDELDKSFRDEIFDSLKAGFFKIRTAVADRNK